MVVRNVRAKPPKGGSAAVPVEGGAGAPVEAAERYRRLPTGTHGLDPEEVRRDQRKRLQTALIELVARRGYRAVRILDVSKLARVSRTTFYSLYADKEALFLDAYDEISSRAAEAVTAAYRAERAEGERDDDVPMRVFCALAAAEPEGMSLFVLGAFGAGAKALERRKQTLEALEWVIRSSRNPDSPERTVDLTAKVLIGGTREVTAARLRHGRSHEPATRTGSLTAWSAAGPTRGRARTPARRGCRRARGARRAACRAAVMPCRETSSSTASASGSSMRPRRRSRRRASPG
jgi:AcrR family transcriptional regulator